MSQSLIPIRDKNSRQTRNGGNFLKLIKQSMKSMNNNMLHDERLHFLSNAGEKKGYLLLPLLFNIIVKAPASGINTNKIR